MIALMVLIVARAFDCVYGSPSEIIFIDHSEITILYKMINREVILDLGFKSLRYRHSIKSSVIR